MNCYPFSRVSVPEVLFMILSLLCVSAFGKECTNIPTQLSSHTLRYELLSSTNETWKEEMFSQYHLSPTDDSAWSNLLSRKMLREEDESRWAMMYKKMKYSGESKEAGGFLREVSLHNVRLDSGSIHGRAQLTNLEYLLMLDVDSLVWNFRYTSGLETPGDPYGGWESPTSELRGHFVGHYLSASAQMWASTHNGTLKEKMHAVVDALSACQEKMGTGYLSAFPSEQFDRFEAIKPVWAPYYTIHKIMAGLLDQHLLADNPRALKMVTWMVEYFYNRVQNVIKLYTIERHWVSLNEEIGGMNDVLYRLYIITGEPKHLLLAHLFDKPCFLGSLALQADEISDFHANTHIPVVVGSQMRYEVTGDPLYKTIALFFMDIVNSSHSYATGGTSVKEFWSNPKRLASTLQTENEETCTTYNMLKVSRHLFRWTREMAYAEYYERALTNGVLSIQRGTEPGVMIYMLPLGQGVSKARSYHKWGTKFNDFWCCYGTGIESFSKLGDSIYFDEEGTRPGLYIIQYISSSIDWKSGHILLHQNVDDVVSWDPYLRVALTFSSEEGSGQSSTLNMRIPFWTYLDDAKAAINGQNLTIPGPGNFLSVTRKWNSGDKLTLQLPIRLRLEAVKDDRPEYSSLQAILFGPYLLVGLSNGDRDIKLIESATSLADWITPIPASYNSLLVSLCQKHGNTTFVFTDSNKSITMEEYPDSGTDGSVHATFRLVLEEPTSLFSSPMKDAIGRTVRLEPYHFPGMVVVQQGAEKELIVTDSASGNSSLFHILAGLDGKSNTISLESKEHNSCFIYSGSNHGSGRIVKLSCVSGSANDDFNQSASFRLEKGASEYHPISFKAKGANRNFLLEPLLSLRDESYTVYFNITAEPPKNKKRTVSSLPTLKERKCSY